MGRKWLKYFVLAVAFTVTMSVSAWAQIEVAPESQPYKLIPVVVKNSVPDGAKVDGPGLVWPAGIDKQEVSPGHWLITAPPGEYTIEYRLKWLHIVPITFKDFDGKEVTFQNYLGSGEVSEKATFKIVGKEDDVPVPPPTPGSKWGLVLRETASQSPAFGNLLISLREKFPSNKLVIHDPSNLPPSLKSLIPSATLPALMVLARQADGTDKFIKAVPLQDTSTVADVEKELK